jgi:hypothetical protein
LLAAVAIGCGTPDTRTPTATVDAYFRDLARDPIRTLPLLTPTFHRQHGLGVVTATEAQQVARGGAANGADAVAPAGLDRLQLGWLAVQSRDSFRALRDRFTVTPGAVTKDGASAMVVVRVEADGAAPFDQRFELSRSAADGAWRIESVEQQGVLPENLATAFVAHPSEVTRRHLAQPGGRSSR